MTTVKIEYDCPSQCTYTVPTTLHDDQTALRHATLVDTLAALVDVQHEQDCPDGQSNRG